MSTSRCSAVSRASAVRVAVASATAGGRVGRRLVEGFGRALCLAVEVDELVVGEGQEPGLEGTVAPLEAGDGTPVTDEGAREQVLGIGLAGEVVVEVAVDSIAELV